MTHHHHGPHAHEGSGDLEATPRPGGFGTRALGAAFLINLAFTLVEAAGGWWTDSFAVISDAFHDAGDCLVLGLAWYLQGVAMKGRDARYSYGYGRYRMLGGWLTSVVLIVGAGMMLIASVPRILSPVSPDADGMMLIAVFGLVMNGIAAWMLHGGSSLNERGAFLHLLEDVLGWAAVLIGAVVIHFTGWTVIDAVLGIGISLFIGFNAFRTLREGTRILMQGQPTDIDMSAVRSALLAIPNVRDIHDQHTWTLDGSTVIHSLHLVVGDVGPSEARAVKDRARHELGHLGIGHTTIEIEWAGEECGLKNH